MGQIAVSAPSQWEYRAAAATFFNGGLFDPAFGGTDYSQSDTPILTRTDGSWGANSPIVTVPTSAFDATMEGNGVGLVDGAAFIGHFQILSVDSPTQITVDRNISGTATSGDVTLRVGGAILIAASGPSAAMVGGNKGWVRAGTYSISSNTVSFNAALDSLTNPFVFEGYTTTRGDGAPTRPVLDWTASGINVLTLNQRGLVVRNLEIDARGHSSVQAAVLMSSTNVTLENCTVRTATNNGAIDLTGTRCTVRNCHVIAGSGNSDAIFCRGGGNHVIEFNTISSEGSPNNFTGIVVDVGNCLIRGNVVEKFTFGVLVVHAVTLCLAVVENNVFHRCTHGVSSNTAAQGILALGRIWANIFSRLTNGIRYVPADISANTGTAAWAAANWDCNFFFSVTNPHSQVPTGSGVTTLTADPFTAEATGDFSLNNVTGGGALVRSTPCEVDYADGINSATIPAGITGTPAAVVVTALETARSLWRELTNERTLAVVPDATEDLYLQLGAEEVNRRLHYHVEDDSSSITLVAGTQEYATPDDWVEIQIVEHNGREVEKSSIETLRAREQSWRSMPDGAPQYWAHYSNKLVFVPAPDAAAVAADATPFIRVVTAVPSVTTSGFEQLPSQEIPLAVLYAAYLWSIAYPDSALAQHRAAGFLQVFESGIAAVGGQYQRRGLPR